jgi:acyl-CoA thioesterase
MSEKVKRSPGELAKACAAVMWNDDAASRRLGMSLDSVSPGAATLTLTITDAMANGHGNCHGGYIFTLADSAFAFACNSRNELAVAQHCSITYIDPVRVGDRLTAVAREISRRGRNGICDVEVRNQDSVLVAVFRGHSRTIEGKHLPEET